MQADVTIHVERLGKVYRLYDRPVDRLKEAIHPGGRSYHREFHALREVSFDVGRGETFGIIGRNGSGKSTLLKTIAGVLTPSAGTVRVAGRVSALLELGAGFNPELTGLENVYLQGTLMGFSRGEMTARCPAILAFADIGDFIAQPVKHYSSGMFVRLAFACAIHVDPDILIVDEALAVGDVEFQQKCYGQIARLKDAGTSILLVSHDLGSIVEFCDRAMLLDHGRTVVSGPPDDVVNRFKQLISTGSPGAVSPPSGPVAAAAVRPPAGELSRHFTCERNVKEYGEGVVSIVDWGVLDAEGRPSAVLDNDADTEIVIRLQFHAACENPVAGYFLTDAKGREIVGTNTAFEGVELGARQDGETVTIRFRQKLAVAPGVYLLNIGCSEYVGERIVAHHRLYNLAALTVHSRKRFVGFCALNPVITVEGPRQRHV